MDSDPASLPDDIAALKAMVIATTKRANTLDAEIANLKLTIAKLQHSKYGSSSERARLLDQLELQLSELEEQVAQNAAQESAAPEGAPAPAKKRPSLPRPARRPLPAHLPRERIIYPPESICPCCKDKDGKFRKLGADETETLERVPAHWKVVVHSERLSFATSAHSARETRLPQMRHHRAGSGAVASHRLRPRGAATAGGYSVRRIPGASAVEPPKRHLRQRRRRNRRLDHGRS